MTEKAEETTWIWFADQHPHEAAELDWPRFLAYVRSKAGWDISEAEVREDLKETP